VLLKVRNADMQGEEFLYSSWFFKAQLASFLLPGGPMGLFNQILAAGSREDLAVLYTMEHEKLPNGRSLAPKLIGVNDVWHVVMYQERVEKSLRRLSLPPILQEKLHHCAGIIDGPP